MTTEQAKNVIVSLSYDEKIQLYQFLIMLEGVSKCKSIKS